MLTSASIFVMVKARGDTEMTNKTTCRTETHEFYVFQYPTYDGAWSVEYRPINSKTGKAWQASRRVEIAADIAPRHWDRPVAYSSRAKALLALGLQKAKLAKR